MRLVAACLLALNLVGLSFVSTPTFAAEKVAKLLPAEMAAVKPALPAAAAEPVATPVAAAPKSAEETVKTVCAACHGADGNSAISLNPKLAGQHPEYLLKQLTNFKEGKRANAVMAGMVANLSPAEMKELAKYFAGQKLTLGKAKSNGAGSLGVPACAGCHGATGAGIPKQYPRMHGQHADYNLQQLRTLRTGERANAPMMMAIAAKMTDAEMAAVADYMQGLR
jgi:cytochrome c553